MVSASSSKRVKYSKVYFKLACFTDMLSQSMPMGTLSRVNGLRASVTAKEF
eukprot:gene26364-32936_t